MFLGYAILHGNEIWNNKRTLDYLRGRPLAGVPGMVPASSTVNRRSGCDAAVSLFCDPPPGLEYLSISEDPAPWYDPIVAASLDFAGLFVESVDGFDSVVKRDSTDSAILGGFLGPMMLGPRTLTVTGWLRARTCAGAEYGLRWLNEALLGNTGCDDSLLGDLYMLVGCPPDSDPTPNLADYSRTMLRVGLADGPKVTDRSGVCCGNCGSTMLRVTFTLVAESPYIFSEPDWVAYQEAFTQGPFEYDLSIPCSSGRCPEAPAPWTPACAEGLTPPPDPFFTAEDCYCEPWITMRNCFSFENTAQWNEVTGVIEVQAGADPVRNLKVVAFRNLPPSDPTGRPCPCHYETDPFWRCVEPCVSIAISGIPSGGRLVIDSRTREITMTLPGGSQVPGLQFVSSGETGRPFEWLDIGHCTSLCVVASVQATSEISDDLGCDGFGTCPDDDVDVIVTPDVVISVGLANRYLASGS